MFLKSQLQYYILTTRVLCTLNYKSVPQNENKCIIKYKGTNKISVLKYNI